ESPSTCPRETFSSVHANAINAINEKKPALMPLFNLPVHSTLLVTSLLQSRRRCLPFAQCSRPMVTPVHRTFAAWIVIRDMLHSPPLLPAPPCPPKSTGHPSTQNRCVPCYCPDSSTATARKHDPPRAPP